MARAESHDLSEHILHGELSPPRHRGRSTDDQDDQDEETLCYVCEEHPATRYLGETQEGTVIRICDAAECDSEVAACFSCGVVHARRKMHGNLCQSCA
jgi:hypothetical protein